MVANPVPVDTPHAQNAQSSDSAVNISGDIDETEMPLPSDLQTFFLGGIFILGILAAIYVASPIFLSVALAVLLQPLVRLLDRAHLPRVIGALLVIALVIGSFAGLVAALSRRSCPRAYRVLRLICPFSKAPCKNCNK